MRLAAIAIAVLAAGIARAEIVDRVAVTVADSVITESDIDRQIRLTAFLNGTTAAFTPSARRAAADMLVEQALVRREMNTSALFAAPLANRDVEPQVEAVFNSRYLSDSVYRSALSAYGLTDAEVHAHLEWQSRLIRFVDLRFRPGVQVSDAEIRDYYESNYVPEWKRTHPGAPPTLADARDEVERTLLAERANNALDRWLGRQRRQTDIRYHPEAFR